MISPSPAPQPPPRLPRSRRVRGLQLRLRPAEGDVLRAAAASSGADISALCRASALARAASLAAAESAAPPSGQALRRALYEAARQAVLIESNLHQLADWWGRPEGRDAFPARTAEALAPLVRARPDLERRLAAVRATMADMVERLTARPGRAVRRTERLHVVLTESEHRVLRAAAAATGLTVSEFVRGAIGRRHGPPPARWPLEAPVAASTQALREAGRGLNHLLADAHFERRGARPGEPVTAARSTAVVERLVAALRALGAELSPAGGAP